MISGNQKKPHSTIDAISYSPNWNSVNLKTHYETVMSFTLNFRSGFSYSIEMVGLVG